VPTYDLAPEMRGGPITNELVAALDRGQHDFIVANYANPDMVGHTGVWDAAVLAAEFIDGCLGRLARAALGTRSTLVITADHGNIEEMRDAEGHPQTKHTTSPVPIVLVSEAHAGATLRDGELADVAPTLCALLGIPRGPEMTGTNLLEGG
jgi:2,3-bisphosphoglycerate-independent phosphoglycerate mutase